MSHEPATQRSSPPLVLSGQALTPSEIESVSRHDRRVEIGANARDKLTRSRATLERAMQSGSAIYGVNTGFGSFAQRMIEPEQLTEVQHNLIRSHTAGVGDPLAPEIVRAMMLLLAASLCRGHSGVRTELVDSIVALLNAGVTPIVPSIGSVGASGDLAPLAHVAQVLIGEGEAHTDAGVCKGDEALKRADVAPLQLSAKEGLALINGTHLMAAQGALLCVDVPRVFDAALAACAMSIDAARATDTFLDARVHQARGQVGQQRVAARLLAMLEGSEIIPSHYEDDPRVQDPYSFRCAPQVLGACLDQLDWCAQMIGRELGAVTDNPLIFSNNDGDDAEIISAGNFHGAPLAIAFDSLAISLSHIAGISERRVFALLAAVDPESHLRPHLSPMPGLHSGLMITQYTAAACCNELIGLATPASVSNISTCAGMEDYNSFGPRAAAKARRGLDLCAQVVAIELLCASEGIEHHRPLRSGSEVEKAHEIVRSVVPPLVADRSPAPDIDRIATLVLTGRFGD